MAGTSDIRGLGRDFWLLASGQAVSALGDSLQKVALAWLVLQTTRSALATSMVFVVSYAPSIISTMLGGVLADRMDKRRLLFAVDMLRMVLVLAFLPLLRGPAGTWWAYGLTLALSALTRLYEPGRGALLPRTVHEDRLPTANAVMGFVSQTQWAIGPAIAGVVVAWLGPLAAMAFNASTFAVSGITVMALRLDGDEPVTHREPVAESAARSLATAAGVVRSSATLRFGFVMDALAGFALSPLIGLLPLVAAANGKGAQSYGALNTATAVGLIIGSAVLVRLGDRRAGNLRLLPLTLLGTGLLTMLVGFSSTIVVIALLLVLRGSLLAAFNVPLMTLLQRESPQGMLGRVLALNATASDVALSLGLVLSGAVADVLGLRWSLVAAGAAAVLIAVFGAVLMPRPGDAFGHDASALESLLVEPAESSGS